jgi:hypothetical protein
MTLGFEALVRIVFDDDGKSQGAKKAGIALSATAVFALLLWISAQSIDIDFSHTNRCWRGGILSQQKLTYFTKLFLFGETVS